MSPLLTEFIALFVYGPILVLLHELGHALFARFGGYRVTSFGIGLGEPWLRMRLSGPMVVHLDRWWLAGGACVAIPDGPPTSKRIWFHGGGLIVQGLLALVLLLLPDVWWVERVAQFNLLVALTNAIPWRFGGSASDGWYILDALSGGRHAGNPLSQRAAFEQMADREHANRSPLGLAYAELGIAWADVLAGRLEEAGEFFADDPPETAAHPWTDALYHYVKAEWHLACGRPLAALGIAREGRASVRAETPDHLALLALVEARALVALDEPDASRRALQRVLAGPLAIQALPIALWNSLDAPTDDLVLATWKLVRAIQAPWLDPGETVLALLEASDELAERNELQSARSARDAAIALAERTLASAAIEDRRTLSYRLRGAVPTASEQVEPEVRNQKW